MLGLMFQYGSYFMGLCLIRWDLHVFMFQSHPITQTQSCFLVKFNKIVTKIMFIAAVSWLHPMKS